MNCLYPHKVAPVGRGVGCEGVGVCVCVWVFVVVVFVAFVFDFLLFFMQCFFMNIKLNECKISSQFFSVSKTLCLYEFLGGTQASMSPRRTE